MDGKAFKINLYYGCVEPAALKRKGPSWSFICFLGAISDFNAGFLQWNGTVWWKHWCRPIFLNSGLQIQVWPITMVFVLTLCVRLNANYLFMFTPLEQIIGSAAAQLVAERDLLMFMTVYSPILSMMTVKQGSNLVGEEFKRLIILLGMSNYEYIFVADKALDGLMLHSRDFASF